MKTKNVMKYFTAAAFALGTGVFTLSAKTLEVGDPAPQLQAGQWVQGEPVTLKAFNAMASKVLLLDKKFETQLLEEKWDEADATVAEIIAILGAYILSQDKDIVRTEYRVKILMAKGDTNAAFQEVARIWGEYPQENPQMFHAMAAEVLSDPSLNGDALELVEEICNRLDTHYQKVQFKAWQNLACLARISFIKGDTEKAIKHQQEAIDAQNQYLTPDILEKFGELVYNSNVAVQKKLQSAMESYKAGQLPEWPELRSKFW